LPFIIIVIMSSSPPSAGDDTTSNNNNNNNNNNKDDASWDSHAEHYSNNMTRFTSLHANDLIGILHREIADAKTILDIGCGPGTFGVAYLNHFPNGIPGQRLIFSDLAPGMVNKCQHVMEQLIKDPKTFQTQLVYQVEDGSELKGIEDDSIDVVVSIFGVFLIPDQEKTLETIRRVLRKQPNGVFATAAWTSIDSCDHLKQEGFGTNFQNSIEASLQSLLTSGSTKGNDGNGNDELPSWKRWSLPDNIKTMLPFDKVAIHRSIHSIVWSSVNHLWELIEDNPMTNVRAASPEVQQAAKQRMVDMVTHDGNVDSPVMVWSASNLVVARGTTTSG
jgi:ubiquinone/menaquinone biosynthesis C-methylase UbiE